MGEEGPGTRLERDVGCPLLYSPVIAVVLCVLVTVGCMGVREMVSVYSPKGSSEEKKLLDHVDSSNAGDSDMD